VDINIAINLHKYINNNQILRGLTMDKYIAIGKAQYHDSKDQVRHFKSKNDYQARHHIINYFDSSLIWTFTRNNLQE